jgi:hypothetical protein
LHFIFKKFITQIDSEFTTPLSNFLFFGNKFLNVFLKFKILKLFIGHTGQGIDIHGFEDLMPEAIESGNPTHLISRIRCCYMFKTSVPFRFCARLGGAIGLFFSLPHSLSLPFLIPPLLFLYLFLLFPSFSFSSTNLKKLLEMRGSKKTCGPM